MLDAFGTIENRKSDLELDSSLELDFGLWSWLFGFSWSSHSPRALKPATGIVPVVMQNEVLLWGGGSAQSEHEVDS